MKRRNNIDRLWNLMEEIAATPKEVKVEPKEVKVEPKEKQEEAPEDKKPKKRVVKKEEV